MGSIQQLEIEESQPTHDEDDDGFAPLVSASASGTRGTARNTTHQGQKQQQASTLRRRLLPLSLLVGLGVALMMVLGRDGSGTTSSGGEKNPLAEAPYNVDKNITTASSAAASSPDDSPLTAPFGLDEMKQSYADAKEGLYELLRKDYGADAFQKLFLEEDGTTSRGRSYIRSAQTEDDLGWDRLKRKVVIKVLKALENGKHQSRKTARRRRLLQNHQQRQRSARQLSSSDLDNSDWMVPFVWATGGHSAAAGHGNFFNQSYTAYVERATKDVYAAAGLRFEGRNYAMGGHPSGPEIAFCVKEVFGVSQFSMTGSSRLATVHSIEQRAQPFILFLCLMQTDFDVLSWDYGMTDGKKTELSELYFYRAMMNSNHPAAIMLDGKRKGPMKGLLDRGVAALTEVGLESVQKLIPDTEGLNEEQINAMPPYIRSFRCGRQIEKGEPRCQESKFDMSSCPNRRFRTSWHPGWKAQALRGNLVALFLIEVLGDALTDIDGSSDREALLIELESQEQADRQLFLKSMDSQLPDLHTKWLEGTLTEEDGDLIRPLFYRYPNYCHIAQIPAQIRFKGILTETAPVGMFELETGLIDKDAGRTPNRGNQIRLVAAAKDRQRCPVHLNMDHSDYFYIHQKEELKELTIPNDSEVREYGTDQPIKGLISLCDLACSWGKCPAGTILGGVNDKMVNIMVNGQPATSTVAIQKNCYLLRNSGGFLFKPDENGRFTIRIRVNPVGHYVRYSSFAVW